MDTIFLLVKMILFLGIILYLAQFLLHYLERYSKPVGKNMQILDKIQVSKTSSIGVVKILDTYYLMSFAEQSNEILKELDVSEVANYIQAPEKKEPINGQTFSKILQNNLKKVVRKGKSSDEEKTS